MFKKVILTILCALTMLLSSYREKEGKVVYATYYDYGFRNKLTANGMYYDPNVLTCATLNRKIPFGTILEITNTANGKKVRVTVNDRMGLTVRGRPNPNTLDLSVKAFKSIGAIKTGKLKVTYKVIKVGDGKTYHHLKKKR